MNGVNLLANGEKRFVKICIYGLLAYKFIAFVMVFRQVFPGYSYRSRRLWDSESAAVLLQWQYFCSFTQITVGISGEDRRVPGI